QIKPNTVCDHSDNIKINHHDYLQSMLKMNRFLETSNKKMFQAVCLRTALTDKYVPINTAALKDIFGKPTSDKTDANLWQEIFNVNIQMKGYTFNNLISTDGTAVSINLINNYEIPGKEKKKAALAKGRAATQNLYKGKTSAEKEAIRS